MIAPGGLLSDRQRQRNGPKDAPRACCLTCGDEVLLAKELITGEIVQLDLARPRDVFALWTQGSLFGDAGDYPEAYRAPVYREHRCVVR